MKKVLAATQSVFVRRGLAGSGKFQSERRLFSEDEGTIHEVTRKRRVFRDALCDFVDRVPTVETRQLQNDPLPAKWLGLTLVKLSLTNSNSRSQRPSPRKISVRGKPMKFKKQLC